MQSRPLAGTQEHDGYSPQTLHANLHSFLGTRLAACLPGLLRTQMNLADSERMAGALELAGYQCSTEAGDADVIIFNTCSIREKAENKVYSALGPQASVGIHREIATCRHMKPHARLK